MEDDLGLLLLLLQRTKTRKKRVADRAVRKKLTRQDTIVVVTYWQEMQVDSIGEQHIKGQGAPRWRLSEAGKLE